MYHPTSRYLETVQEKEDKKKASKTSGPKKETTKTKEETQKEYPFKETRQKRKTRRSRLRSRQRETVKYDEFIIFKFIVKKKRCIDKKRFSIYFLNFYLFTIYSIYQKTAPLDLLQLH
jgi:hypothetical protein